MKTALAIFAKTPELSPVKTRLAMDFGQKKAETFYRMSVDAVEEMALTAKELSGNAIDLFWAAPEKQAVEQITKSFPVLWTGGNGLGESLANISEELFSRYKQVILIGTDSPQLKPSLILEAIDRLSSKPDSCVIGPSADGGFYLFGSNIRIPRAIWTRVEYSRENTLKQLLDQLAKSGYPVSLLSEEIDVDHFDDLNLLYQTFYGNQNGMLPEQRKLYIWLERKINYALTIITQ